jgi:plastocyanin domain-containing protein
MTQDEIVVTVIGIILIAFVLWFFLAPSQRSEHADHTDHTH